MLLQRFGHFSFESLAAQIFGDDGPFPVEQIGRWDADDAIFSGQFVLPCLAIEVLAPGHLSLRQETRQSRLVIVEADTDDFKAFGVILLISLQHIREFSNAGFVPGCSEIDQNNFALIIGH